MENITIKDIVEACSGQLLCGDENKVIKEFSIDSRSGSEDSIFVPIIGERVDAHKFIDGALKINGATFTSEHDEPLEGFENKPWIKVADTVEAMQKVGTFYRNRMNLPVVAVTGSVGKTTTREMISTVLASQKKVFQTIGNQNSQIGVPLTLSHLTREDEIAVLEIGMSERGQIEKLTNMIRPNVAVVTMIGVSHIAQLKTQENICLEKMDIVKGLPEDGMVFLNGDDKFLAPYRGKLSHKTFFYGMDKACDYRAGNVHVKDGQTIFHFFYKEGKVVKDMEVVLGTMGEHNVRNALGRFRNSCWRKPHRRIVHRCRCGIGCCRVHVPAPQAHHTGWLYRRRFRRRSLYGWRYHDPCFGMEPGRRMPLHAGHGRIRFQLPYHHGL